MLNRGKIIAEAPPEEFKRLDDPRVQQFIHGEAEGPLTEEAPARGAATPGTIWGRRRQRVGGRTGSSRAWRLRERL